MAFFLFRAAFVTVCFTLPTQSQGRNLATKEPERGKVVSLPELFPYERKQLTNQGFQDLYGSSATSELTRLLDFDDGSDKTGKRLQSGECKEFPGFPSWPSQSAWETLNTALQGALIATTPLAAPCFRSWASVYNEGKCTAIKNTFSNPYTHEDDPTSTMWPLYQGRSCLPPTDANATCTLGGSPSYVVNASSVEHIQLAVNFARNTNLRLVIKNTGHCYLGKSNGAGALGIWTHGLKDIKFFPKYKNEAYEGAAMKLGAGVTVREMYDSADHYNVTALGGICQTVGYTGGYLAGGGHSPLVSLYGMASDQVLSLEVVTADGRFVTASPTENTDLFWALRGGGGSTFGVVTSATVRIYPILPVVTSSFSFNSSQHGITPDIFWAGVRTYVEKMPALADAGTYSYFWVYNRSGVFVFEMRPLFAPNHTLASFTALSKPLFDNLHALGIRITPNNTYHSDYLPAYDAWWGKANAAESVGGVRSISGSRIFPRSNWASAASLNATIAAIRHHSEVGKTFGGYHLSPRLRVGPESAVNPAFRRAAMFLITMVPVPENATPAQLADSSRNLGDGLAAWRAVSEKEGGSYLNEAHVMEPDWQQSFYGENYEQLLAVKRKWDPKGVFYAWTGVGSEEWEIRDGNFGFQTQNGRLCRR